MPRLFFRKITPRSETVRNHWVLRPFGRFFGEEYLPRTRTSKLARIRKSPLAAGLRLGAGEA